ncbi:MAG: DUF885 domain-containing protein, partial [Acidimicrobiales bacterium]
TDYSPDGHAARLELCRRSAAALDRLEPGDDRDRIAKEFAAERLSTAIARAESGEELRALNILHSPMQSVRQVFDVMARDTEEQWEAVASRMEHVPTALAGLRRSLDTAVADGRPPARRQVLACAAQAWTWSGQTGGHGPGHDAGSSFFEAYVDSYGGDAGSLARRLRAAAETAASAYAELAAWLEGDLAAVAAATDPVGAERYQLSARTYLGAPVDTAETYAWGWEEVHRIEDEMRVVAGQISAGATVAHAAEILRTDPALAVHGEDALVGFLQDLMDRTIEELDGVHFDIPDPLKTVEAMIDPPGGAAAPHYSPPSEDFSRPGRTWYPTLGKTVFPLWGEVSTCYHESVPGHHLQSGHVRWMGDELTKYQRRTFTSGHGEGWALYAERLMDELGKFDRPGYRLGYLRSQLMRALRVVVDIGMHLEYSIPATENFHPGERWTPALGAAFLFERSHYPRDFMSSELDRYLGLPAQAVSYKVGERAWLAARAAARRAAGDAFDLKAFHTCALGLGPVGLDQLVDECGRPSTPAPGAAEPRS